MNAGNIIGHYYGYPQCCIDDYTERATFLREQGIDITDASQIEAGGDTGFIPCLLHSKQILEGQVKIEDLIQDRKCKFPFPEGGTNLELEEYLEKILI